MAKTELRCSSGLLQVQGGGERSDGLRGAVPSLQGGGLVPEVCPVLPEHGGSLGGCGEHGERGRGLAGGEHGGGL